jgi:hypothetical protein
LRDPVAHPAGDHPALASAAHGEAGQLLSFDDDLASASTGAALRPYLDVSVRTPRAFVSVFDAASVYDVSVGGSYPGPDTDPRA